MGYKRRYSLLSLVTSYKECKVDINKNKYIEITEGFMKFIASKLLNGEVVNLPVGLGQLNVIGRKQNLKMVDGEIRGLAPDWKSTLKLWENKPEEKEKKTVIYFFNEHTRGIRYKFGWNTSSISLRTKNLFTFIATRSNKRILWKRILEGKEYQIVKSFAKI
jgi:hypothetical protein